MAEIDLKLGNLQLGAQINPKSLQNMFMSLEKKNGLGNYS